MRQSAVTLAVVTLLVLAGCYSGEHTNGHSHEHAPPDLDGLKAATAGWEAAFDSGDAVATAAVYSPDARVFPPDMPPVEGRAAIQELWQGFMDAGLSAQIMSEDLEADSSLGYRVGAFVLTDSEGAVVDEGHFMEVWKNVDGTWMMVRDTWNSDVPKEGEEM